MGILLLICGYSVGFSDFDGTYIYLNVFVNGYFLMGNSKCFFPEICEDSTIDGCGDNIINKKYKNHGSHSFI